MTLLLLSALLRCMKKFILSLAYKKNGYRGFIFHVLQKLSSQTGGPWGCLVCAEHPAELLGAEGFPTVFPPACPLGITDVSV